MMMIDTTDAKGKQSPLYDDEDSQDDLQHNNHQTINDDPLAMNLSSISTSATST